VEVLVTSRLLETKVHVPRRRRGVVDRPRLSERLKLVRELTLTFVFCGPGEIPSSCAPQTSGSPRKRLRRTSTA
jgi:hypothetical protein